MEQIEELPKMWLRCNRCFVAMKSAKQFFSLTSCTHIFCHRCSSKASTQCPLCKSSGIASIELQEPLKQEFKHCFEPVDHMLDKFRQCSLFQNNQHLINAGRFCEIEKKYETLKCEYMQRVKQLQDLREEHKKGRKKLEELKKKAHEWESKMMQSRLMTTPVSYDRQQAQYRQNTRTVDSQMSQYQSFLLPKHDQPSVIRPITSMAFGLQSEFLVPQTTRVPRSRRSARPLEWSSRGSQFPNYTPYTTRN